MIIFWRNCLLHMVMPRGYGFQARLQGNPDEKKLLAAKKVRIEAINLGWHVNENGIKKRNYASDEEYRIHQAAKLDVLVSKGRGWGKLDILEYRWRFWRRFRHLRSILSADANLLCLGARQGTEVEVLLELGYRHARGIDLNPGLGNPLVSHGDFMNLDVPDNHLDLVYSNCLDHAWDLDDLFREQVRALKASGYFLMDITTSEEAGSFESQEWGRPEAVLKVALKYFRKIVMLKREKRWFWVLLSRPIKE